jgi:positive regulator of sigma E activity
MGEAAEQEKDVQAKEGLATVEDATAVAAACCQAEIGCHSQELRDFVPHCNPDDWEVSSGDRQM